MPPSTQYRLHAGGQPQYTEFFAVASNRTKRGGLIARGSYASTAKVAMDFELRDRTDLRAGPR